MDIKGIISEIGLACFVCNAAEKIEKGIRGAGKGKGGKFCKDINRNCPFVITSRRTNGSQGMSPGALVFRKYGLNVLTKTNTYKYGKSHFLFYLYHSQMNWQPPQHIPDFNRFGQLVNKETDIWTLAHLNGDHYDDSRGNLMWLLKSEHGLLEPNIGRRVPVTVEQAVKKGYYGSTQLIQSVAF